MIYTLDTFSSCSGTFYIVLKFWCGMTMLISDLLCGLCMTGVALFGSSPGCGNYKAIRGLNRRIESENIVFLHNKEIQQQKNGHKLASALTDTGG